MSDGTWTDMFCGAGGSSTGIAAIPDAANHWDLAIEVHAANHTRTGQGRNPVS